MVKWLQKAIGEISKLRQTIGGTLGFSSINVPYVLNSSKVNYELARQIYHNTHNDYKLGAGFAKPIINTLAGFMGVPRLSIADEDAQTVLDDHVNRWMSRMQRTHQLSLRDGDCYVMLANLEVDNILYPESDTRVEYIIIPPEQVTDIEIDPITRQPVAYILSSRHKNGTKDYTIIQRYTSDHIETKIDGDAPNDVISGIEENKWGFIPIVHFKNEPEETEKYGSSELEPVEPYLKAYHDLMLQAIQGCKMHATPKLQIKVKNVEKFLQNNFPEALTALQKGQPAQINLQGRELLLFSEGEEAQFIEARSSSGDAEVLLKLLFFCIVDVSEVPEFAFGVHTPSSHASVKEQMPLLIRRVARKREQVTENWQLLARMLLAMYSKATGKRFATYETTITWDAVVERDEKEFAETLDTIVKALVNAVEGNVMSLDAAVDLLKQYVDTMKDYISDDDEMPGERERIMKTRLLMMRLEDGQFLDDQKAEIDKELEKVA